MGVGTSTLRTTRCFLAAGSGIGTALNRACEYGCLGSVQICRLVPTSTKRGVGFGRTEAAGGATVMIEIGADVDQVSHDIFEPEGSPVRSRSYNDILSAIGRKGDLTSKVRESLVSIGRLLLYLANEGDTMRWAKEPKSQLKGMQRDVQSLSDHASYINSKIQFLLDALLGVVSLEQNNIIKIFSVMAVVLMPPTLIASIYGMNFKAMPELEWSFGYPLAIVLMLVAAALPYLFFTWKKWL